MTFSFSDTVDYSALPPTVEPGGRSSSRSDRASISRGMSIRGRNNEQYLVIDKLGAPGAQADVYIARKHNEDYVVKVYHGGYDPTESTAEILERNECPYIAALIEHGMYAGTYYYEVYTYYPNGTLADWIAQGKCTQTFIKRTLLPSIDKALDYLHGNGLVHGDLKPSNIFIAGNGASAVLGDFGVASILQGGQKTIAFRGTLEYAPPVNHEGNRVSISPAYDYGALGLILFEAHAGYSPFSGKTLAERDEAWLSFDIAKYTSIPIEARALIAGLLDRHERTRFGHRQIEEYLGQSPGRNGRQRRGRDRGYRSAVQRSGNASMELGFVHGQVVIAHDLADILQFCESYWDIAPALLAGNSTGKLGMFLRRMTGTDDFFNRWVWRFASESDDERVFLLCSAIRSREEGEGSHSFVYRKDSFRNVIDFLESVRDGKTAEVDDLFSGECLPEYMTLFGYGGDVSGQTRDIISAKATPQAKASRILSFCSEPPELLIANRKISEIGELLDLIMSLTDDEVDNLAADPALSAWLYVHNCQYPLSELEAFE